MKKEDSWLQTHSGVQFHPFRPEPEMFIVEDIAHSLARLNRFNGHLAVENYSVAEHCVHMSRLVAPEYAKWALMHDMAEAYIGDMAQPIKAFMPAYQQLEENLLSIGAHTFDLELPIPGCVKVMDSAICIHEKEDGMAVRLPWGWEDEVDRLEIGLQYWRPKTAKKRFLERVDDLF